MTQITRQKQPFKVKIVEPVKQWYAIRALANQQRNCIMDKSILCRSGIYQIRNISNGKLYIGSAVNLANRWSVHKNRLSRGTHHSKKLQNAWIKYGECSFLFEVIQRVADLSILMAAEQRWMDEFRVVSVGYNMTPTAGSSYGYRYSAESKEKMAAKKRGRIRTQEEKAKQSASTKGRTLSPSHRANLAAANRARAESTVLDRAKAAEIKKQIHKAELEKRKLAKRLFGWPECKCLACLSVFTTKRSEVSRGGGKYCCKECYWAADRKKFLHATAADRGIDLQYTEHA